MTGLKAHSNIKNSSTVQRSFLFAWTALSLACNLPAFAQDTESNNSNTACVQDAAAAHAQNENHASNTNTTFASNRVVQEKPKISITDSNTKSSLEKLDRTMPAVRKEWTRWLHVQQTPQSSISFAEQLVKTAQKTKGLTPDVVCAYSRLAELYYLDGRNADAEAMLKWSLDAYSKTQMHSDQLLGILKADLGQVLFEKGKYAEAEKLLLEAIDLLSNDNSHIRDKFVSGAISLPAKHMAICKTISNATPTDLRDNSTLSLVSISARLTSMPLIPTMTKAGAYLALARVHAKQGKTETITYEYRRAKQYSEITIFDALKKQFAAIERPSF